MIAKKGKQNMLALTVEQRVHSGEDEEYRQQPKHGLQSLFAPKQQIVECAAQSSGKQIGRMQKHDGKNHGCGKEYKVNCRMAFGKSIIHDRNS